MAHELGVNRSTVVAAYDELEANGLVERKKGSGTMISKDIWGINRKRIPSCPFADVSVNLPLFIGDEGAAGRTLSYAVSEMTAILEGLERYCGTEPRGKRTVIHDSYRNLKDHALNPTKVGVHAKEQFFGIKTSSSNRILRTILDSLVSVLVVLDVLVALLGAVGSVVAVVAVVAVFVAAVAVVAAAADVAVVKSSGFLKRRRCPCIDVAGTFL